MKTTYAGADCGRFLHEGLETFVQPDFIYCPCCGLPARDGHDYIAPTNEQTERFVREHPEQVAATIERLNAQIRELQRSLHAARVSGRVSDERHEWGQGAR